MLTVLLANYNHAQYLPMSLAAILGQTRPADEIIIVDDASTDNSIAIIGEWLPRLPRGRLIRNAKNIGVNAIMNDGIKIAKGDIIYFAAADDIAYPRLFEIALKLFAAHPTMGFFAGRADLLAPEGARLSTIPTPLPIARSGFVEPRIAAAVLMRDDGWFNGVATLYRRIALQAIGGFDGTLGSFSDGFAARKLALTDGSCFSPEILGGWRRLEGGIAWSETADLHKAKRLVELVTSRIEREPCFPAGYAKRWSRRYLFAAHRLILAEKRRRASQGSGHSFITQLSDAVLIGCLFLILRPWDIASVLRRRVLRARSAKPVNTELHSDRFR